MENNTKKQSSADLKRKREDNGNERFDSDDSRLHHHQESHCFNNNFFQESNFLATVEGQNPEEQKKIAPSDNDHKEYLLAKTSDETTTTSTKKPLSDSMDLDLRICGPRFPTNNFERGCDQCSFKLFGRDIYFTLCNHMINNKSMMIVNSHKNQDSETEKKKKTKKHQKKEDYNVAAPTHELPESIIEGINRNRGGQLQHLGTKNLTKTDVDKHQNRLNFANSDALLNALTPEERVKVTGEQSQGMEVKMMHASSGREYTANIRKRTYSASAVINRQWSKLVSENGLSENDSVQIWGYRGSSGEFSLVLNVVTSRRVTCGNPNQEKGFGFEVGTAWGLKGKRGQLGCKSI